MGESQAREHAEKAEQFRQAACFVAENTEAPQEDTVTVEMWRPPLRRRRRRTKTESEELPDGHGDDKPTEKPPEKQAEKTPKKRAEKPTEKAAEERAEKPTEKAAEKLADKPSEKQAEKPPEKRAEHLTKRLTDLVPAWYGGDGLRRPPGMPRFYPLEEKAAEKATEKAEKRSRSPIPRRRPCR